MPRRVEDDRAGDQSRAPAGPARRVFAAVASSVHVANLNPFFDALLAYRNDPVGFCKEILRVTLQAWQEKALRGLLKKRKLAVRSGRGVGKSFLVACAILWMLFTQWPIKIAVTAPAFPQLRQIVFPEIRLVATGAPLLWPLIRWTPTEVHAKIGPGITAAAYARTGRGKEGMSGFHAPKLRLPDGTLYEGTMAVFVDEAAGVVDDFFEGVSGSQTGANNFSVYTGNPTRLSGEFYDTFNKPELAKFWHLEKVSSLDSENVDPSAFVAEAKARYGEDSDAYRVHVLGEFPAGSLHGLIPIAWLEDVKLFSRFDFTRLASRTHGFVVGVDVAGQGADRSVIVVRQGRYILADYCQEFRGLRTDQLTTELLALNAELLKKSPVDPRTGKKVRPVICVDANGIGAGVYDNLKGEKVNVRDVIVQREAPDSLPACHRLRDYLGWQVREFFNPENDFAPCILYSRKDKRKAIEHLIAECSRITFDYAPASGAIRLDPKVVYRKLNEGRSPDYYDALANTFVQDNAVPRKPKPQSFLDRLASQHRQHAGFVHFAALPANAFAWRPAAPLEVVA